ncbi:MAG TPA: lysylphosphatidylglycerol synthase domain-containing protein [Fimbriimonadaceae bacterium]
MAAGIDVRLVVRRTAVALALVGFAWALHSVSKQIDITAIPHPWFLLLTLGLFLIHYEIQAIGWHLILRSLSLPITLSESHRMWVSSLMARWIPGPFIYSAARLMIAKDFGLPSGTVAFAIVLEMCYIVVGAVVTTLVFLGGVTHLKGLEYLGWTAAVLVALCLVICFRPHVFAKLLDVKPLGFLKRRITKDAPGPVQVPQMKLGASLGLLFFYTGFWMYSGFILLSLAASKTTTGFYDYPACASSFAGSWFVGFLAVLTPAGLGVREGAIYLLLDRTYAKPLVVVLAILLRLGMLVSEFTIVGLGAGVWHLNKKKVQPLGPVASTEGEV